MKRNQFSCEVISYDLNTRKEINFLPASLSKIPENEAPFQVDDSMLYFGRFDRKWGKYVLTGGATNNLAKIVDISNKPYAVFKDFEKELYCGEWSSDNSMIALSGDDGVVRVFEVNL